jgi:16S rRNA C967 or C1407 C5-methylase (RsmB/RsmF family)
MQRRGPRQRRKRRREALEATVFNSGTHSKWVRHNDWIRAGALLNYLDAQGIEYDPIFETPLPVSLRVNRAAELQSRLDALKKLNQLCSSGQAFKLPWIEDSYQLAVDRESLKEVDSELYSWVATETTNGTIIGQETVSMIPVALLKVQSHHACMDLCASPGSKTTQILQEFHGDLNSKGFIVANDCNRTRACTLATRCMRAMQHSDAIQNLAIVCHFGQRLPNSKTPVERLRNQPPPRYADGPYDRICCDVPCSGDGTLRKDKNVMKGWHASFGLELHQLQLQIAFRGLALLKIGGMMTYSTCSFNPVEDEAVVHALITKSKGAIEIIDTSEYLPGLKRRPGWYTWKVLDDDESAYSTYDEVPEEEKSRFNRSMFPPPQDSTVPLERCMRIHPSDQNTGGFFITLLRKVRSLPGRDGEPAADPAEADDCEDVGGGELPEKLDQFSNFKISPSLREHLSEQGGSRFNVVYMGQRTKGGNGAKKTKEAHGDGSVEKKKQKAKKNKTEKKTKKA